MTNKCTSTSQTLSTKIKKEADGQIAFRFGEYKEQEKETKNEEFKSQSFCPFTIISQ